MSPINPLLLNGHPKATAIVRFDHSACLIIKGKKEEFLNVNQMKKYIGNEGLEVNIEYIQPASIRPIHTREWNIISPRGGFIKRFFGR